MAEVRRKMTEDRGRNEFGRWTAECGKKGLRAEDGGQRIEGS